MMESLGHIDWADPAEGLPAFLILLVTPLTFSITYGIGAGFVSFVAWKSLTGKSGEIKPFLWFVAFLFMVVFLLPGIERWV